MAKRGPNKGVMHIKKQTQGTSNEISFSVLDAKKNTAGEPAADSPRTISELGKVSLFTLPGKQQAKDTGQPTSAFSQAGSHKIKAPKQSLTSALIGPVAEVSARKHRRRLGRVLNAIGAVALIAAAIFAGGNFISGFMERQQQNQTAIDEAISFLEETDAAIVQLDAMLQTSDTQDKVAINRLFADLSASASLLDRAANNAQAVANTSSNDQEKEIASQIKEDAFARKDIIAQGRIMLEQIEEAKAATSLAEAAWATTVEADALAQEAAVDLGNSTQAEINKSNEHTTEAMNKFQEALVLVRQAKAAYGNADFSALEQYLELRSAAQQNALASNMAILEQDRSTAEANSAAYNEAEKRAAALAENLPNNPDQPIIDAFEALASQTDAAYQEARARTARADAALRSYKEN